MLHIYPGSTPPPSLFELDVDNKNPSGLVTDGQSFWVSNDKENDPRVYVYDMAGTFLGDWMLDPANTHPSGITIDVANGDLYVVDRLDAAVYKYTDAATRLDGSQLADAVLPLDPANHNPEGIADPVSMFSIGDTVAGLTTLGELDQWLFEAVAGEKIYVDFQELQSGSLDIELRSPTGTVLLTDSGAEISRGERPYDLDNGPLTLPESGVYTFELSATDVVFFQFQLHNFPETSVPINVGDTIQGDTAPNEIDLYTFDATVGQRVYFDAIDGFGFDWRLVDPAGSEVFHYAFGFDPGTFELTQDGTYQLLIVGREGRFDNYTFQLIDAPDPITTEISIGDVVSGSIDVAGEEHVYVFDVALGQRVYFDAQPQRFLPWRLVDPNGTTIFDTFFQDQDTIEFTIAGEYLLVLGGDDRLGPYQFQLREIAEPVVQPISIGQTVSGSIGTVGEIDIYRFDVASSQTVYFDADILGSNSRLRWTLVDPNGVELFVDSFRDVENLQLTELGQYDLVLDGTLDNTPTYEFTLFSVPAPTISEIAIGDTFVGSIDVPGEIDIYEFDATAGTRVFFHKTTSFSTTFFELLDPSGTPVTPVFNSLLLFDIATDGRYQLVADFFRDGIGDYQLELVDVPQPTSTQIAFDELIVGSHDIPGEVDIFTFEAVAGQRVFVERDTSVYWAIIDPSGNTARSVYNGDSDTIELDETGTYQLLMSSHGMTGEYGFVVHDHGLETIVPIDLGVPVSGAIDVAGRLHVYSFDGVAGQTIVLDVLFNESNKIGFALLDPTGRRLFSTLGDRTRTLSITGTYRIVVDQVGSNLRQLGIFSFLISDGTVTVPPSADLVISDVTAPLRSIGNPAEIDVTWTVTNAGQAATAATAWVDEVYIGTNSQVGFHDPVVGRFPRSGGLDPGESYTVTHTITFEPDLHGEFVVSVGADAGNNVFEDQAELTNNVLSAPHLTAVFPPRNLGGEPDIQLDLEDGTSFPTDSEVVLSGNARAAGAATNVVFAIDISGSTASPTGLDANFDGIVNSNDDFNGDGRIGDILDVEIGAVLETVNRLSQQAEDLQVAVLAFASAAHALDASPLAYYQSFVDPSDDDNANQIPDFEEALRSLFFEIILFGVGESGARKFRSFKMDTGTNFQKIIVAADSLLSRSPDSDQTQFYFLTDGQPSVEPSDEEINQLAAHGIQFRGFQITGTAVTSAVQRIADLVDAVPDSSGDAILVSNPNNLASSLVGSLDVAGVTVNGRGVQSLDVAGNFFTPVTIESGANIFDVHVIDSAGNKTSTSLTLIGVGSGFWLGQNCGLVGRLCEERIAAKGSCAD